MGVISINLAFSPDVPGNMIAGKEPAGSAELFLMDLEEQ